MNNTVLGDLRTSDVETEFAKFRARFEDFNKIRELGSSDDVVNVKETFNLLIKGLRNVNDPCRPYVFSPLLAPPYSTDRTYSKGDWTIRENAYWICTEAITVPEKWHAEHWERHDDLIAYILSQIGGSGATA